MISMKLHQKLMKTSLGLISIPLCLQGERKAPDMSALKFLKKSHKSHEKQNSPYFFGGFKKCVLQILNFKGFF